jgi:SAM-dependent methyltransferase
MDPSPTVPSETAIRTILTRYEPRYARRDPKAAIATLQGVVRRLPSGTTSVLDVGGGTGLMGQALADITGAQVTAIDVVDRFLPDLTIATGVFNGATLDHPDDAFAAVMLLNVMHHVPRAARTALMIECLRVAPLVIVKDHVAVSRIDHARLAVLDAIGNIPFGGMVRAWYLDTGAWKDLATSASASIATAPAGVYRSGLFAKLFPNRLEAFMEFRRHPSQSTPA